MASNLINTEWLIYLVLYLSIGYYFSRDTQGILNKMMSILGWPIEITQKLSGTKYIPYLFLLPNMIIFGLFTFAPLGVNFGFSASDGMSIMFSNREFSGFDNVYRIFSDTQIDTGLENYQDDKFYASLINTFIFVIFQVPVMITVALFTAVNDNDFPLLQGTVFFFVIIFVIFALLADLLYTIIDPRVRLTGGEK